MMLAAGPLIEFAKFLQIVSWIILPVLLTAVLITVFIHYRRKKKREKEDFDPDEDLLLSYADNESDSNATGAYVLFDHSGLIRQYQNKLSYNQARYTALKHDFEKLERKYSNALETGIPLINIKNNDMENNTEQLQIVVDKVREEYTAEKKELLARLEQLDRSYKSLESENESLLEQVNMRTVTDDEKGIIVNQWKEENIQLKNQVKEQQYLKDILEEKKAQIEFLQNQAEQRIKNYYSSEQQKNEMTAELEVSKKELIRNREELNRLQTDFQERDDQLEENQLLLISKLDHITYLENMLQELRQQNEMLNAAVGDGHDRVASLQQQLEDERSKLVLTEQKLLTNKQLLHRLYKEFSACMEEEGEVPPVVTLRPAYISKASEDWDETAVQ